MRVVELVPTLMLFDYIVVYIMCNKNYYHDKCY